MAISRTKRVAHYDVPGVGSMPWTYASSGGTVTTFVGDNFESGNNTSSLDNYILDGRTYRVHTFDTPGNHTITFDRRGYVDLFILAGGGAGGAGRDSRPGGGGGAGGLLLIYGAVVDAGPVDITVGAKMVGNTDDRENQRAENSSFSSYLAIGGGAGSRRDDHPGVSGGSGGGSFKYGLGGGAMVGQGNVGGFSQENGSAGGGGGAGQPGGSPAYIREKDPGSGGDGLAVAFASNTPVYYAGGGAGAMADPYTSPLPTGGLGGGGGLGGSPGTTAYDGANATGYGSGGGGAYSESTTTFRPGGNGSDGLVMIRYVID